MNSQKVTTGFVLGLCLLCAFLCLPAPAAGAEAAQKTLLFCATGEDLIQYVSAHGTAENITCAVVQAVEDKEKKNILKEYPDTLFLGLKSIKDSKVTEGSLKKNWETEKAQTLIATMIRQVYPDRVGVYSLQEIRQSYLNEAIVRWLEYAADISLRSTEQTDTYLIAVPWIWNPLTGETAPSGVTSLLDTAQARWGGPPASFLQDVEGLNEDGFLTEGVYLLEDEKNGRWAFVSEDLHIEITRQKSKSPALTWYESDIRVREDSSEYLRCFRFANGRANRPAKLAAEAGLVFGINTDFYQFRQNQKGTVVGLIIRDGEKKTDTNGKTDRLTHLPPLDTLLLTRDGSFRLDLAGTLNAEQALAMGATDVLSFGPVLILDGRLRSHSAKVGRALEPRTAIGCYESGHYLALTVEGRQSSSRGVNLVTLGQMLLAKGVSQAINLDGGHTSVLMFMGKQLNTIGGLDGTGTSTSRNLYELLGVGVYQPEE